MPLVWGKIRQKRSAIESVDNPIYNDHCKKRTDDGNNGGDSAWNPNIALFTIAIATRFAAAAHNGYPRCLSSDRLLRLRMPTSSSLRFRWAISTSCLSGSAPCSLRTRISYALIAVCVFLHDLFGPPYPSPGARITHNLTAVVGFTFVVYVIQRYAKQREQLDKTVRQQRDQLLQDVELAAQVQRMFLPIHRPAIPGLEIAGMMQPARGVSGDYYDYIPIDEHTIQIVIADVAGKGVPAALLMSATAAAVQLEAREKRDMLEVVNRLNSGLHSLSDSNRYVTLLLADIDARSQSLRYVNCGHNPALLFQAKTHDVVPMNSLLLPDRNVRQHSLRKQPGQPLCRRYSGSVYRRCDRGREFTGRRIWDGTSVDSDSTWSSLSADGLMNHILESVTDFCRDVGFDDDATILVVKFNFDSM